MATVAVRETCDVGILARLIRPERHDLPITAARAILKMDFEETDRERMRLLAAKARAGTLTTAESTEINEYERVGHLLGLLHLKARMSLKKHAKAR